MALKRFLFLDIDGVVNHNDWYYKNRVLNNNWKCGDADPEVVKRLNSLKDLDVQVVISSSWGKDADKLLRDTGFELPIVGHTEHFYNNWICRGNEIAKWLDENFIAEFYDDDYEYVIFDDDKDFLISQENNFIWVDSQHGVCQEHINKARKIFTRCEDA